MGLPHGVVCGLYYISNRLDFWSGVVLVHMSRSTVCVCCLVEQVVLLTVVCRTPPITNSTSAVCRSLTLAIVISVRVPLRRNLCHSAFSHRDEGCHCGQTSRWGYLLAVERHTSFYDWMGTQRLIPSSWLPACVERGSGLAFPPAASGMSPKKL